MIKVYDSNEKNFATNGIKILHPLKAEITKEDNGDYYCEFQDTIENYEYYQKGKIITVPTRWGARGFQGFRCESPKIINRKVEVKAWHLSYDSVNYVINECVVDNAGCNYALQQFNDSTDVASPFTVSSQIDNVLLTLQAERLTLWDAFNWLSNIYGGHLVRDNWNISIDREIGEDRGIVLAYAKNITEIQVDEDWSEVCTKILPYTYYGDIAITLDNTYLTLDESLYDIPYTKVIEFKSELDKDEYETEEAYINALKEWLEDVAEEYLEEHKEPKVNYSVSALIQDIGDVGDVIKVKHPNCTYDIDTTVIKLVYDAIADKYISIDFGNFKKELKTLSQTVTDKAVESTKELVTESQNFLQKELREAEAKINGVFGNSYVKYNGSEILVLDAEDEAYATKGMIINSGGIGFGKRENGQWTFDSAWTLGGELDMQKIDVQNMTADFIKTGTLVLGKNNDELSSNEPAKLEVYDELKKKIVDITKKGIICYKLDDKSYVVMNGDVGFAGRVQLGAVPEPSTDAELFSVDAEAFTMAKAVVKENIEIAGKIKIVPVTGTNTGVGFVAL